MCLYELSFNNKMAELTSVYDKCTQQEINSQIAEAKKLKYNLLIASLTKKQTKEIALLQKNKFKMIARVNYRIFSR
jgi:hypothetical protein